MQADIINLHPEEPMLTIHDQLEYDLYQLCAAVDRVAEYQNQTLIHCPCLDKRGRKVGVNVVIKGIQDKLRMLEARANPYNQGARK